ncbi:hypothetical protein BOX15_Mlig010509g1, partial [Macrostomum lignano]
ASMKPMLSFILRPYLELRGTAPNLERYFCFKCAQLFAEPPCQTADGQRVCAACCCAAGIPVAMRKDRALWRDLRPLLWVRCPGNGCQAVHLLAEIDQAGGLAACPACRFRLRIDSANELAHLLSACLSMCDLVDQFSDLAA